MSFFIGKFASCCRLKLQVLLLVDRLDRDGRATTVVNLTTKCKCASFCVLYSRCPSHVSQAAPPVGKDTHVTAFHSSVGLRILHRILLGAPGAGKVAASGTKLIVPRHTWQLSWTLCTHIPLLRLLIKYLILDRLDWALLLIHHQADTCLEDRSVRDRSPSRTVDSSNSSIHLHDGLLGGIGTPFSFVFVCLLV